VWIAAASLTRRWSRVGKSDSINRMVIISNEKEVSKLKKKGQAKKQKPQPLKTKKAKKKKKALIDDY
jgi:hypothetical protein